MQVQIPSRVIQTGRSRQLSLLGQAAATTLRCLNPGFEFLFFEDADVTSFVEREFPQHLKVFHSFPYRIQRYDFFRYLAISRLGGFYFDLDVFFAASLQPLLQEQCVFPFEELTLSRYLRGKGMDWEIGNYAFGAAPGHPFLDVVIENCVRAQRDPAWVKPMLVGVPALFQSDFYVLNTTGPGLLSRSLAENPDLHGSLTVLFPHDVRDESHWHCFGHYGVHLMDGTWREKGGFVRRRLANWWEGRTRKKLTAQSASLGPLRKLAVGRTQSANPCLAS